MDYVRKAADANKKARSLGKSDRITPQQVKDRFEVHDCKCIYCGSEENITLDHQIPFHVGGRNIPSNIAPACWSCNRTKSTLTPWQWKMGFRPCLTTKMHDRPKCFRLGGARGYSRKNLIASFSDEEIARLIALSNPTS